MVRVVISLALAAALGAGCGGGSIRAGEGVKCSTDPDEDPQYVCSPAADLVCITTYSVLVTNEREAPRYDGGIRQVFVCRLACEADEDCRQGGDVCCPGLIVGKNYGKMAACVPSMFCTTRDGGARPDGPPREAAAPAEDASPDRPADAGAVDAPAAPVDAAVDAVAADDAGGAGG